MLAKATGVEAPEQKGLESFIPARAGDEPVKETPDDIMAKGANWLSDIKKASYEFKKAYEELRSKKAVDSPATAFVKGLSESVAKKKEAQREELTAEERKDAFVKRRGEDRPSTYAPSTINLKEAAPGAAPGYGDVTRKTIEVTIRDEATKRGIDPEVAVAIFRSEGAGNYQSQVARSGKGSQDGKEDSYGPFQLYRGGGLGNAYEKATGRDLRKDNTLDGITTQVRFALDQAVEQGWAPWYGRKTAGVGVRQGLAGAKPLGNWK